MLVVDLVGKCVIVLGNCRNKFLNDPEVEFGCALVHFTDALPFEVAAKTQQKTESGESVVHEASICSFIQEQEEQRDQWASGAKNKTWSRGHIDPAWQTGPVALVITLGPAVCAPFPLSLKKGFPLTTGSPRSWATSALGGFFSPCGIFAVSADSTTKPGALALHTASARVLLLPELLGAL